MSENTRVTDDLINLLEEYGVLVVSLGQLARERPGSPHETLEALYESFGGLLPNEHALVVRISKDREIRFLKEGEHDVSFEDKEGKKTGIVTVWELPEDEFWFFRAFRPALFGLEKKLPVFLFEIGIVHAFAMFEGYLSEILRARLRQYPRLMGSQRELKYEQVFSVGTMEALIEEMIDREIRELTYLSFPELLLKMRTKMGFRSLSQEYDEKIVYLSLLRNCLLHNRGRVDARLSTWRPTLQVNSKIPLSDFDVSNAVNTLRHFAYQLDQVFEARSLVE